MKRKDVPRDALRLLAQQRERGEHIWVAPWELQERAGSGDNKGDSSRGKASESRPGAPKEAKKRLEAQPLVQVEEKLEQVSASPEETEWEFGAPEPEAVIPLPGIIEDPFPAYATLDTFREAVHQCVKCPLGKSRNKFVFGVGDPNADLVLIGEAPGADEDALGEPFVGRAGKLLDKILSAVNLRRGENVYIANILKCRPPGNRDPLPIEVERCEPYLVKQLQLIRPKLIVALGRIAAQTLLRTSASLGTLRQSVHDYHGVPLLVTYHPAALLRNANFKRPTWEDVQKMKHMLDEQLSG